MCIRDSPHSAGPSAGGAARSAVPLALGSAAGGVSDVRRFGAVERAVWPIWARWGRRPLELDFGPPSSP
eukprot:13579173-Alexandrium_andersonii.AAC.1